MWTVLLVDDTSAMRVLLRTFAEAEPTLEIVGEAVTGEDAVTLAGTLRPDAIVLDQEMPRMTGLEALPHLRAALPAAVIVMYSSATLSEMEPLAFAAGADAYFHKGDPPATVLRAVAALLERKQPPGH